MRVTVVGAGVVGLTTALRLCDAGWAVRVVTAAPIEASTSYLAAAVWFPTHVAPIERVMPWGQRTYEVLTAQAAQGVPGVVMLETMALYPETPPDPPWAAAVGGVRAAKAAELPEGYRFGLRYRVPLAEMPRYMPWLVTEFTRRGGILEIGRIHSLSDVAAGRTDAVVNCSGLGARDLADDPSVYPVRGQMVRVTNPGLTLSVRDEYHPAGRTYVHPRSEDCLLGGTADEGQWDTRVDLATAAAIVARCKDLVPVLADASVIGHVVGLRPARPVVRLEEAPERPAGVRIVHNYGHGGAGVTLSWGCAEEVVDLLGPGGG